MKKILKKLLVAVLSAVMIFPLIVNETGAASEKTTLAGTIFRVSPTGVDSLGCGSESQPCQSIQYAVNQAVSGDTILVAAGTYKYNVVNDLCTVLYTRAVVCVKNKQLAIHGGYSNDNWVNPDPVNNLTKIDGESSWRGVAVIRTTLTSSLDMQGFTIENGRAFGQPLGNTYKGHAFGGGMYAPNTFVHLKDMVFKNNTATGGSSSLYAQAGWAFGGGLALEGPPVGGNSSLENVVFSGNLALGGSGYDGGGNGMGGGLMAASTGVTATNLTFTNNTAKGGNTSGNACTVSPGGFGGAVSLQYSTNLNFSNFTATGNKAIGGSASGSSSCGGPGIGGVFFLETVTLTLSDAMLKSNQALGGVAKDGGLAWAGGLYTEKVNLYLKRVKFIANVAQAGGTSGGGKAGGAGGGGAYLSAFDSQNYTSTLTNCLFAENIAARGTPGTDGPGGGGGLFIQAVTVNIVHSTFVNNKLENGLSVGQGIIVIALYGTSGKSGIANLKYSAISDHLNTTNISALTVFPGNLASLSYIWFGNNTSHYSLPAGTPISHIWTSNQSGGYFSPSSPDYDYHPLIDSPLVDIGVGSTTTDDLDGLVRPVNLIADIGAYEFRTPTLIAQTPLYFATDSNDLMTAKIQVNVNIGIYVEWTATANANWVYLGPLGSSQETTGQTGDELVVRVDPSKVSLGDHKATILIDSPTADPAFVEVYLIKVEDLKEVYLPLISR